MNEGLQFGVCAREKHFNLGVNKMCIKISPIITVDLRGKNVQKAFI